jgi:hypothetical protein
MKQKKKSLLYKKMLKQLYIKLKCKPSMLFGPSMGPEQEGMPMMVFF